MTESTTQISAYISAATKSRLEAFVQSQGLKKARVVEDALLHHLQALSELPADIIIPPRLMITEASLQTVIDALENPPAPSESLKKLWHETD